MYFGRIFYLLVSVNEYIQFKFAFAYHFLLYFAHVLKEY